MYKANIRTAVAQVIVCALVCAPTIVNSAPLQIPTKTAPNAIPQLPVVELPKGQAAEVQLFGRHGPLTPRETAMAKAAWQYFVVAYQEKTGLVNAVGSFPSTTMWDTASYVSGLVSAYELGIIDKSEFDGRAYKLIGTLRSLDLFRGELPNKVYDTTSAAKVDYANKPGEVGYSALDIGRLLVWMRIVKERYPYLANSIDNVLLRWTYCHAVGGDGRLFGAGIAEGGATKYYQEGRLGYEEYAAKGFALWGFYVGKAESAYPFAYTAINGVQVPYDERDPRLFGTSNYVLTESYLLDGIELNWDLPGDSQSGPAIASQGWRAEFANRVYLAQERRFEETGIITARSEHQVEGAPYFVYDSVFSDGYAWNTQDPGGTYSPDRAAVATKAAIGMWALWDRPYTDLLFETVADLYTPDKGFDEGVYENGSGTIPLQTANNNGIILAALLYKARGPILQYLNGNTQYWATAFENMDARMARCLPILEQDRKVPCPCNQLVTPAPPALKPDEFIYCKPLVGDYYTAATDCRLPIPKQVFVGRRQALPSHGPDAAQVADQGDSK